MVYVDVFLYKTWMEETYDMPNKNPYFGDYRTKSDVFFCENADI